MAASTVTGPADPLGFFDRPETWVRDATNGRALDPTSDVYESRRLIYQLIKKSPGDLPLKARQYIDSAFENWEANQGPQSDDAKKVKSALISYQSELEQYESKQLKNNFERAKARLSKIKKSTKNQTEILPDMSKTDLAPTSRTLRDFLALLIRARLSLLATFFFYCVSDKGAFTSCERGPYLKWIGANYEALWEGGLYLKLYLFLVINTMQMLKT